MRIIYDLQSCLLEVHISGRARWLASMLMYVLCAAAREIALDVFAVTHFAAERSEALNISSCNVITCKSEHAPRSVLQHETKSLYHIIDCLKLLTTLKCAGGDATYRK